VKCDAPLCDLTLIYLRNFYVGKTGCYSVPIFCDNTGVICLSKNPILHSRAKHI